MDLLQELKDFKAIDMSVFSESGADVSDNIKNSVVLYNKALENLRAKSEDIAIIELKKAIALNPDFYEAMNLLGICYSYIGENEKAAAMFDRVMAAEHNSVKAMKYMQYINHTDTVPAPEPERKQAPKAAATAKKEPQKGFPAFRRIRKTDRKVFIKAARYAAIAAIAILAVMLCVFAISRIAGYISKYQQNVESSSTTSDTATTADNDRKQLEDKLAKANEDLDIAKKENDALRADLEYYKNAVKLFEVERLAAEGSYEAAADTLVLMKGISFKPAEKSKYDSLCGAVMSKAAYAVYTEGTNLYYAKNYQEALNKLNKLILYGVDLNYMDWVMYEIGMSYKALNDVKSATEAFQKLIDTYPGSQYAQYAQNRLSELSARP